MGFRNLMNNYFYGKQGQGDFTLEKLPQNRRQLFRDVLKVRWSSMVGVNLLYVIFWIPAIAWTMLNLATAYSLLTAETGSVSADDLYSLLATYLLILAPCIAVTGPFNAGITFVLRNWARDEHAFIWSDFKDAVKENWKQSLVISIITGFIPLAVYEGWAFYGEMAARNTIMIVPQVLVILFGIIWAISVAYMYPIIVTYSLKMKDVLRNGLLLGVARLPFSVGLRLLHCVPLIIFFVAVWFFGLDLMIGLLILGGYYMLIGFALSRFITASYTNAVFDKYINSRIEGAKVNQGLRTPDDDEDEDEDETNPE